MLYSQTSTYLNDKKIKEKYSTQMGKEKNRKGSMGMKGEIKPKSFKWDKESFQR